MLMPLTETQEIPRRRSTHDTRPHHSVYDHRRAAPRRVRQTEILEHVLSFLPPRALFVVQRVSQQWKDTIVTSPAIEEKMFLRCRIKTPEIWMLTNPDRKPISVSADGMSTFPDHKFRTVSVSEVKSGDWKGSSGGIEHLFTPVTLSHSCKGNTNSPDTASRTRTSTSGRM